MSVIYQFGSTPSVTYKKSNNLTATYKKGTIPTSLYQAGSISSSTYQVTEIPSVIGNYNPPPYLIDFVLVGGGGGGGYYYGGGGGGGQILQVSSVLVEYGKTFAITIGNGGTGSQGLDSGGNINNGENGGDTTFLGYSAIGGGGGASRGNTNVVSFGYFVLTQSYSSGSLTMHLNTTNGLTAGCVVSFQNIYFAEITSVNSGAKTIQITGISHAISSSSQVLMYAENQGGSSGASGGGGCGTDNAIVTSSYGSATFGNRGGYGTGNYFNSNSQAVGNVAITDIMGGGGGGAGSQGNDGGDGGGGDGIALTFGGSSYTFAAGGGAGVDVLNPSYGENGGPSGGSGGLGGYGGSGGDGGNATSGQTNSGSGGGGGGGIVDANQDLPYPEGGNGGSGTALIYSYFTNQVIQINSSGYFHS